MAAAVSSSAAVTKEAISQYLDKHGIRQHMQAGLDHILTTFADEPLLHLANFFIERHAAEKKMKASLLKTQQSIKGWSEHGWQGELDVRGLIDVWESNGREKPPVALSVEECSALLQAQTRERALIDDVARQLKETKSKDTTSMTDVGRSMHNKAMDKMQKELDMHSTTVITEMEERFLERRDAAIAQYTPKLLESVHRFDKQYRLLRDKEAERLQAAGPSGASEALSSIAARTKLINGLGIPMEQPLAATGDASADKTVLASLLGLLKGACAIEEHKVLLDAMQAVQRHVQDHTGELVKVKGPSVKGVQRSCAKVQEEYSGNYLRLMDLVRGTLVFESLHAIRLALDFLTGDTAPPDEPTSAYPGWQGQTDLIVCRIKDRMSPRFDAVETSGGNRDVLLNVWIRIPDADGSTSAQSCLRMIGEVQLHAKPLFELKHGLHTLYKGARILGAMEDSVVVHTGELTERVLRRAENGIVRRLQCDYAKLAGKQQDVVRLLQLPGCALLDFQLAGNRNEEEVENFNMPLADLLLAPSASDGSHSPNPYQRSDGKRIQCTRLRTLNLSRRGLTGPIPEAIGDLRELLVLKLGNNSLPGPLPASIGNWASLHTLGLNCCDIEGPIPDAIGDLVSMEVCSMDCNKFTGPIPASVGKLTNLRHLYLNNNLLEGALPEELTRTPIEVLKVDKNRLTGDLPPAWMNRAAMPRLKKLKLKKNAVATKDWDTLKDDPYWQNMEQCDLIE